MSAPPDLEFCPDCGMIVPWQQAVNIALQPFFLQDRLIRLWRRHPEQMKFESYTAVSKELDRLRNLPKEPDESESQEDGNRPGLDDSDRGGGDLARSPEDGQEVGEGGSHPERDDAGWAHKVFET